MIEINSMKGNTLNKLKEGDARNETQGIGHILNILIGWSPDYEKPKEHTNKLK